MSEGEVPPPSSEGGVEEPLEQDAAAAALARARAVAAGKGLRPGMKPRRKRKWQPQGVLSFGVVRWPSTASR